MVIKFVIENKNKIFRIKTIVTKYVEKLVNFDLPFHACKEILSAHELIGIKIRYKNQYYHAGNIILDMEVYMVDVCTITNSKKNYKTSIYIKAYVIITTKQLERPVDQSL